MFDGHSPSVLCGNLQFRRAILSPLAAFILRTGAGIPACALQLRVCEGVGSVIIKQNGCHSLMGSEFWGAAAFCLMGTAHQCSSGTYNSEGLSCRLWRRVSCALAGLPTCALQLLVCEGVGSVIIKQNGCHSLMGSELWGAAVFCLMGTAHRCSSGTYSSEGLFCRLWRRVSCALAEACRPVPCA